MGEPGRETLYDPLADEEVDGDGIPVFGYLPLRNGYRCGSLDERDREQPEISDVDR